MTGAARFRQMRHSARSFSVSSTTNAVAPARPSATTVRNAPRTPGEEASDEATAVANPARAAPGRATRDSIANPRARVPMPTVRERVAGSVCQSSRRRVMVRLLRDHDDEQSKR